jgi:HAD superfamily hydrolase (TIGR01509 family)
MGNDGLLIMTGRNAGRIRLIIFDLGNVVFEVINRNAFRYWAQVTPFPEEYFAELHMPDLVFHQFERGELTPVQFYEALIKYKKVDLSFEDFSKGWNSVFGEVYPEVHAALQRITDSIFLTALTNTNELHYKVWSNKYAETLKLFNRIFISCQLGFRKPEERAFRHVSKTFNMKPHEILYFDDVAENIEKAGALGMHAVQVYNPTDVTTELLKRGLMAVYR